MSLCAFRFHQIRQHCTGGGARPRSVGRPRRGRHSPAARRAAVRRYAAHIPDMSKRSRAFRCRTSILPACVPAGSCRRPSARGTALFYGPPALPQAAVAASDGGCHGGHGLRLADDLGGKALFQIRKPLPLGFAHALCGHAAGLADDPCNIGGVSARRFPLASAMRRAAAASSSRSMALSGRYRPGR